MSDIRAFPDTTGLAPRNEAWHAIDCETYNYAPDQRHMHPVGVGPTAQEAIADLLDQLAERGGQ